mgnify:CR=1 FL=1
MAHSTPIPSMAAMSKALYEISEENRYALLAPPEPYVSIDPEVMETIKAKFRNLFASAEQKKPKRGSAEDTARRREEIMRQLRGA